MHKKCLSKWKPCHRNKSILFTNLQVTSLRTTYFQHDIKSLPVQKKKEIHGPVYKDIGTGTHL